MGVSSNYCRSMIWEYNGLLKDYSSDLNNVTLIEKIMNNAQPKAAEGRDYFKISSSLLYDGFDGAKAQIHKNAYSNIEDYIYGLDIKISETQEDIKAIEKTLNEKISQCNERISFWQNKLQQAIADEAKSKPKSK